MDTIESKLFWIEKAICSLKRGFVESCATMGCLYKAEVQGDAAHTKKNEPWGAKCNTAKFQGWQTESDVTNWRDGVFNIDGKGISLSHYWLLWGYAGSMEHTCNPDAQLGNTMLDRANRPLPQDTYLILHPDRGCYCRRPAGSSGSAMPDSAGLCSGKEARHTIRPVKNFGNKMEITI